MTAEIEYQKAPDFGGNPVLFRKSMTAMPQRRPASVPNWIMASSSRSSLQGFPNRIKALRGISGVSSGKLPQIFQRDGVMLFGKTMGAALNNTQFGVGVDLLRLLGIIQPDNFILRAMVDQYRAIVALNFKPIRIIGAFSQCPMAFAKNCCKSMKYVIRYQKRLIGADDAVLRGMLYG